MCWSCHLLVASYSACVTSWPDSVWRITSSVIPVSRRNSVRPAISRISPFAAGGKTPLMATATPSPPSATMVVRLLNSFVALVSPDSNFPDHALSALSAASLLLCQLALNGVPLLEHGWRARRRRLFPDDLFVPAPQLFLPPPSPAAPVFPLPRS